MLKTCREVYNSLRISKSTFYQMLKKEVLLRPTLYVGNSPRWRSADIDAWIDSKRQNYKSEMED